jgi:hypothetical protein
VRVIQLTYEQTMEARGLTLIATKAISSLMVEGKMPSAALNEHAQNSATTNLIMELYEQVVSEVEQGSGATGDVVKQTAGQTAVAGALRTTFLALNRVEQEAEQYIGAVDLPDEDDIADADEGVFIESMQDTQPIHVSGIPMAPADESGEGSAQISGTGQQLTMADLWAVSGTASNATPPEAARATSGGDAVSAPAQSATPAMPGQQRVSWDEMRARLQAEAAARQATRRRCGPSTSASAAPGSLWAISSAPASAETGSTNETGVAHTQESAEGVASPAQVSAIHDNDGGCASDRADDTPESPAEGNTAQLPLFG